MEYIYNFNGKKMTLNEFKDDIINDYVNTSKTKKELQQIYPVSKVTLSKILKNLKKKYCECYKCGEKELTEFYNTNKVLCKKCISDNNANNYINLPENKKIDKLIKQKTWQTNNIIKVRVLAAKHRAKRKNLDFDIDEEYIKIKLIEQNYKCKYTNVDLELTIGSDDNNMNPNTLSIDRINPNLGYIKNNIALVSAIVNSMKNDLTESSFLDVINLIQKNF